MNENYSLFRYNSNVLLIVNQNGKMKTLFTPFRVLCVEAVGVLKKDSHIYVEEVLTDQKDEILFLVFNGVYSHHHFKIPALSNF